VRARALDDIAQQVEGRDGDERRDSPESPQEVAAVPSMSVHVLVSGSGPCSGASALTWPDRESPQIGSPVRSRAQEAGLVPIPWRPGRPSALATSQLV
jgi:hypothetical protein